MAAEDMGSLVVSMAFEDNTGKGLNSVFNMLKNINSEAGNTSSKFGKLQQSIEDLRKSGYITSGSATKAIADIDKIAGAFTSVYEAQQRCKSLGIRIDTEQAERELNNISSFMSRFYKKNGRINENAIVGTYGKDGDYGIFASQLRYLQNYAREVSSIYNGMNNRNISESVRETVRGMLQQQQADRSYSDTLNKRAAQYLQISGYIEEMQRRLRAANSITLNPHTDMRELDAARSKVQDFINTFEKYRTEVLSGTNMYDPLTLRQMRNSVKGDLKSAVAASKSDSKAWNQIEKEEKAAQDALYRQQVDANRRTEAEERRHNDAKIKARSAESKAAYTEYFRQMDAQKKLEIQARERTALSQQRSQNFGYNTMDAGVRSRMTVFYEQQEVAARRAHQELNRLVQQYNNLGSAAFGASGAVSQLRDLLWQFAPVYGIQQFVMSIIETGGEIEKQHIALQTIIGDMQEANDLFEGLKGLALQSPFTFGDLTKDVKQLAAYNIEYNELYDTTKRLADIASGLGVSFERIALAYGQVKARSWLDAKELRQFAYAGVPMLQSLADMYSREQGRDVSASQVKSMITDRQVSFEDVQKVLWGMTDEGGKFYNMQLVLSETLLGRYNKLKDAWEIMLSGFAKGDSIVGSTFKTILNFITSLLLNVNKVIPAVSALFASFAANRLRSAGQSIIDKGTTAELRSQIVLQTKKMLAEGTITKEKASELVLEGKITEQEAVQLGLLKQQQVSVGKLKAGMIGLGSVANGLYAALGGWIGILIAGVTAVGSSIYSRYSDAQEASNQSRSEFENKAKNFADFEDSQNSITPSSVDEKRSKLQGYIDFIKENAPYLSAEVSLSISQDDDIDTKLRKLSLWISEIRKASEQGASTAAVVSEDLSGTTKNLRDAINSRNEELAKYQSSLNTWGEDRIDTEIKSLQEAARVTHDKTLEYYSGLLANQRDIKDKRDLLYKAMSEYSGIYKADWSVFGDSIAEDNRDISADVQAIAERLRAALGTKLKDMSGTDTTKAYIARATYETMKNGLLEGIDDADRARVSISIDRLLRIDTSANASQDVIDIVMKELNAADKAIATKIEYGMTLNDAERRKVSELMRDAGNQLRERYPTEIDGVLRGLLASSNFTATIRTFIDTSGITDLDRALDKSGLSDGALTKLRSLNGQDITTKQRNVSEKISSLRSQISNLSRARIADPLTTSIDLQSDLTQWLQVQRVVGKYEDSTKNRGGHSYVNRRDDELRAYKEKVKVVKELISLYEKERKITDAATAKSKADAAARKAGLSPMDWSNPSRIYKDNLIPGAPRGKAGSEREEYRKEVIVQGEEADYNRRKESVESLAKAYEEFNSQLKSQYELREQIQKRYGRAFAQTMTGGKSAYSSQSGASTMLLGKSYERDLTRQLEDMLSETGKGLTADDVLGMDNLALTDNFGDGTKIRKIIEDLRTERQRLQKEASDTVLSQIDSLDGTEAKLTRILAEYRDTLERIDRFTVNNPDGTVNEAATAAYRQRAKRVAQIGYGGQFIESSDQYKKFLSSAWDMDDATRAETMSAAVQNLNDKLATGAIDAETYEDRLSMINDAFNTLTDRKDAVTRFRRDYSRYNNLRSLYNGIENGSTVHLTDRTGSRYGLKAGEYSKSQIGDEMEKSEQGFSEAINDAISGFEGLISVMQPVADMFEKLGMSGLSDVLGAGGDALSAASGVQGGVNSLAGLFGKGSKIGSALSSASPFVAAGAAGLSLFSFLFGNIDASLQDEIEELQSMNKKLDDLKDNIEWESGNAIGGLYSQKSYGTAYIQSMLDEINRTTGKYLDRKNFSYWDSTADFISRTGYSGETYRAYAKASKTKSAYDTERAALLAERDNYLRQMQDEQNKKDTDDDKVEEYRQSYEEAKQAIADFAKEQAEALYGIDFSSYSENIASSLVDAWSSGTKSVKAYKEAVADMLKSVVTNVIQQKIIGTYLDNAIDSWYDKFNDKSGVLDDELYEDLIGIFDGLGTQIDAAKAVYDAAHDAAEKSGYDWEENDSTLSSNIEGITEDTADLLASYLNAVRADVSVNRSMLESLTMETMPGIRTDISLSLAQLRGIKATLDAMAYNVESIHDMMNDITIGNKKMYVAMKSVA